jgi:hypothetical protein
LRSACLLDLFQGLNLHDPNAGIANGMVIAIAVELLDDDLGFHPREIRQAPDLSNIVAGQAGARA